MQSRQAITALFLTVALLQWSGGSLQAALVRNDLTLVRITSEEPQFEGQPLVEVDGAAATRSAVASERGLRPGLEPGTDDGLPVQILVTTILSRGMGIPLAEIRHIRQPPLAVVLKVESAGTSPMRWLRFARLRWVRPDFSLGIFRPPRSSVPSRSWERWGV